MKSIMKFFTTEKEVVVTKEVIDPLKVAAGVGAVVVVGGAAYYLLKKKDTSSSSSSSTSSIKFSN